MNIQLAESDEDLEKCFPVMVQLRDFLSSDGFRERVQLQQREGYRLAYLEDEGKVQAIAGFRITETLARGRFLYIDDLVTDQQARSQGYGDALFDWLIAYARSHYCQHLELDSGVQRVNAHRFYFRKRMAISGYHFTLALT